MAKVQPLQRRFAKGMRRDTPRVDLPNDVAFNLIDWIPDHGAPLRKRGGDTYASQNLTSVKATASYVTAGIYAPFSGGGKNIAIDEDGELYVIVSDASTTDVGAAVTVHQNPVFHRDRIIIPATGGSTTPKTYDGTTLANLGGSPPTGTIAGVHKDRTIIARSNTNLNRLWFSDAGDPQAWDTTNTYVDVSYPPTGLASIRNSILIFSIGATERLVGSTPPPGSDFTFGPLFDEGVHVQTTRSICYWGDNILFANPSGVFITDGSALGDITKEAGMLTYWRDTVMASFSEATYNVCGGVYSGFYFLSIMDGATLIDAAMIDIARRTWYRLSNWDAWAMWSRSGPDELYVGRRDAARVSKTSSIFSPTAANKNDADGAAVVPVYEGPFFQGDEMELIRWRRGYLEYDTRDAASDNPTLTLSYVTSPEATSYTAVATAFSKTTVQTKARRDIGKKALGIGFKLHQTNASSDTRVYAVGAELHALEKGVS